MPGLRNLELTVVPENEWYDTTTDALRTALLSSLAAIGGQLRSLMLDVSNVRGEDGALCEDGLLADVLPLVPNVRRLTFPDSTPAILGPGSPPLVDLRALHVRYGWVTEAPAEDTSALLLDLLTASAPSGALAPADGLPRPHEKTPKLRELGFRSHDFEFYRHDSDGLVAAARTLKVKGVTLVDRCGRPFPGV